MPNLPGWKAFELDIQESLGLDATLCSGSKFNDIGDATDNNSPADSSFRLLVDCKYTESASYSVSAKFIGQWVDRATEHGKRFLLALRFYPRGAQLPRDYVLLTLDDFAELYERASRIITLDKKFCDAIDRAEEETDKRILGTRTIDRTYLEREEWKWKY